MILGNFHLLLYKINCKHECICIFIDLILLRYLNTAMLE